MIRLFLFFCLLLGTLFAAAGAMFMWASGFDFAPTMALGAGVGAALAIPVAWAIARALSDG